MDTVLGLSLTRKRVSWVVIEGYIEQYKADCAGGQAADYVTVDHDEFALRADRAVPAAIPAVQAAEQAAAAVLRTRATVTARGERLHAVGVTWSDDAVTEAALLMEALTEAGFDNVVPVRRPPQMDAVERTGLNPARDAALAVLPGAEFIGQHAREVRRVARHVRSRSLSHSGAVSMLVAGSLAFVVSLSLTVSLHLAPQRGIGPVQQGAVTSAATAPVAEAHAPAPTARPAVQSAVVVPPPADRTEDLAPEPDRDSP